jgi:hypothetical protein
LQTHVDDTKDFGILGNKNVEERTGNLDFEIAWSRRSVVVDYG